MFNFFCVNTLIYFIDCTCEEICADLLELDVVLSEELDFVVFETSGDGEDERMV